MNKTGITFGCWDLLHVGHLYFLGECADRCDVLIVGLHVNPNMERGGKNKPSQSLFERYVQLTTLDFVDFIIPYETELDIENMLAIYKPDIRFLGSDYEGAYFTGKELEWAPHVEYIPRNHGYSSSELRNRITRLGRASETMPGVRDILETR